MQRNASAARLPCALPRESRLKLLLDENISRRIVPALQVAFPGSSHVVLEGLASAADAVIWRHAAAKGYTVVSKDDDFSALANLRGYPPKLIRLSLGNCSNDRVLQVLLAERDQLVQLLAADDIAVVDLRGT